MEVSEVQSWKASAPIVVTLDGILVGLVGSAFCLQPLSLVWRALLLHRSAVTSGSCGGSISSSLIDAPSIGIFQTRCFIVLQSLFSILPQLS